MGLGLTEGMGAMGAMNSMGLQPRVSIAQVLGELGALSSANNGKIYHNNRHNYTTYTH
jgi:hypothetical protein